MIDELADLLGGVDVLVNNAGTGTTTALLDIDYNTWREVFATDVDGAFLSLQRAARRMITAGRGGGSSTSPASTSTSPESAQPRIARPRLP